jgi:hypothetical protein
MLISLAVVTVSKDVWISNITDEDVVAFGKPETTGLGSHLIRLKGARLGESGLLTFERRDALFVRQGRTAEAVLFRADGLRPRVTAAVRPDDAVYWVTVGKGLQGNFEIGMRNGVWGVVDQYWRKLEQIEPGDKVVFYGRDVGFALCEVVSLAFHDPKRLWPDADYPYRIRITPPLRRNEAQGFRGVSRHLVDRFGQPYSGAVAAGRAIGGAGGVFRRLSRDETAGLLGELGSDD